MHEQVLIMFIKKYMWQFIGTALCITILHNALENIGGNAPWVKISLGIVNGIYASFFFALIGGYYFAELGIVFGILGGSALGFASIKEISEIFKNKLGK